LKKIKKVKPSTIKVVSSGKEPIEFTSCFHSWTGQQTFNDSKELLEVDKEIVKYQVDTNITKVYTYEFIQECRKKGIFPQGTDTKFLEKKISFSRRIYKIFHYNK